MNISEKLDTEDLSYYSKRSLYHGEELGDYWSYSIEAKNGLGQTVGIVEDVHPDMIWADMLAARLTAFHAAPEHLRDLVIDALCAEPGENGAG